MNGLLKDIVDLIVECTKLMLCLRGFLDYSFRPSRAAGGVLCGSIAAMILLHALNVSYPAPVAVLVCIPVCALSVSGKKRFLLAAIAFFGICCLDEMLAAAAESLLNISADTLLENPVWFSAMNSAGLFLLLILLLPWRILRRKRQGDRLFAPDAGNAFIIFFLIGQIASLIYIDACQFGDPSAEGRLLVSASAYVLGILFLALGIMLNYMIRSKKRYQHLAAVNERLLRLQNDYYQEQLEKDAELRKFRHDISNHLVCVRALLREQHPDQAMAYLDSLQKNVERCKVRYQTGHPLLDAIVNDLAGRFHGVSFQVQGMMSEQTRISGPVLCTIFSNILENAFTAASECPDGGSVTLSLQTVGSSLCITAVNSYVTPVRSSGRRLLTHKKDPVNHGIGHQNVEHCVSQMEGTVQYQHDRSHFRAEIVLPFVCSA